MLSDSVVERPFAFDFSEVAAEMSRLEAVLQDASRIEYPLVRDVVRASFGSGGKRIRPAISLLVGKVLKAPLDKILSLAASVETLHTASLVHDDLIDQSFIRRGHPTLNAHLSAETTVLAGDYLFARAAAAAADTGSPRVVRIFSECLMTMCAGELSQLAERRAIPGREDYMRRIYGKTAALFATAAECAAILAEVDEQDIAALRRYGQNLGLAFQIIDDILDFTAAAETLGKPAGSDLRQGTVTLPALYAAGQGAPLAEALAGNQAAQAAVIDAVRSTDAAVLARADAQQLAAAAVAELTWLPPGPARLTLERLADFTLSRAA